MKNNFKILKIKFSNIVNFKNGIDIEFIAKDRVYENSLFNINGSIYTQNVLAFTGVNASGKTTILRLLNFAMSYLISNEDLSDSKLPLNWFEKDVNIDIYFYLDGFVYKLSSTIGLDSSIRPQLYFKEEILYKKDIKSVTNRENLFFFDEENISPILKRSELDKVYKQFLQDDVSISTTLRNDIKSIVLNSLEETNFNYFSTLGETPVEVLNLLDENIEFIEGQINEDISIEENSNLAYEDNEIVNWNLKFKNSDKVYRFSNPLEMNEVLSSGTIKGNNVFVKIQHCLQFGGYLILDEIENHFNKKIVEVIIDLFMDQDININGAVIIFSTHYTEILDVLDRKDNIYVLRRDNRYSTEAIKYSDFIKRNDVKKSDVIFANKISGTAPKYENIMNLKIRIKASLGV